MTTKTTMIYGPPGTGKTTKILDYLKEEIEAGIDPKRVGLISFTRSAAKELAKRMKGVNLSKNKWVCTLHSMAFKVSGISSKQILTADQIAEFIKGFGTANGEDYLFIYHMAQAKIEDLTTQYKNSGRPGALQAFLGFCYVYEAYKKSTGFVDYWDMLNRALISEETPDIDILFIDEAQDLSNLQWTLIYKWLPSLKALYCAGDDDQSIYAWGGAEPHGMFKFEKDTRATRIVLNQSHRLPQNVHSLANRLISFIRERVTKDYLPQNRKGTIDIWNTPMRQLDIEHGQDCLIVYRNHSLRKGIEDILIDNNIPYSVLSGSPGLLDGKLGIMCRLWNEIKHDLINAELKPSDIKVLKKNFRNDILHHWESGNFKHIENWHWSTIFHLTTREAQYLYNVESKYGLEVMPTVRLTTIHASKGMESDRVILINSMGDKTRTSYYGNIDNEIRTFYVGITRAKNRLDIVSGNDGLPQLNRCLQGVAKGVK